MKDKRLVILLVLASIIAIETSYLTVKFSRKAFTKNPYGRKFDMERKLFEEYLNKGLYEHAIESYEKYLRDPALSSVKKANISYIIGNIYMDNLTDYKNAMANFIRAKVFLPDNPNISEINKKMVMCLERLDRVVDAERELSKITEIQEEEDSHIPKSKEQEIIVANIGDRNITMAELNSELEKLPPSIGDNYKEEGRKIEFLSQYITGELLYDSAKKRGYDKDKDVIEAIHNTKRQMMIEKLFIEEIGAKVEEPTDLDLDLYYKAHKDKYVEEIKDEEGNVTEKRQKEFSEVRDLVRSGYMLEKQQEALQNFINNQMKAKEVRIYEEAFGDTNK